MKSILKENIQIVNKVKNWEEAIEIAAIPLLQQNKIEKKYIQAMIKNIFDLGPYIVIMPKVAMPHARPEDGVNETSLSLLKINNGVSFSENKEDVKLVFVLAAKDSSSHIDLIMKLTDLLDDEEKMEKLFKSENATEFLEII
ncbi:MAG: PTS sugar transporter subunit IIA [Fusobacteriaceae bacterium]